MSWTGFPKNLAANVDQSKKLIDDKILTRMRHNEHSRKGRQKINDQIEKLKNLIPECKYATQNKASILLAAVRMLERLQLEEKELQNEYQELLKENSRLTLSIEVFKECEEMFERENTVDMSSAYPDTYHNNRVNYSLLPENITPDAEPRRKYYERVSYYQEPVGYDHHEYYHQEPYLINNQKQTSEVSYPRHIPQYLPFDNSHNDWISVPSNNHMPNSNGIELTPIHDLVADEQRDWYHNHFQL
jgi:hypothetical protein